MKILNIISRYYNMKKEIQNLKQENQLLQNAKSILIINNTKMTEVTKDTLYNKVKECKQIIVNDSVYFGTISKEKEGYIVKGVKSVGSVEGDVKNYLKADNLNSLETINIAGSMVSIAEKPLNEDNLDTALGVCIKAAQAHRVAVAKLINDSY